MKRKEKERKKTRRGGGGAGQKERRRFSFCWDRSAARRHRREAAGIFPDGESRPTKSNPRSSGRVATRKSGTSWRPTSADRNWDLCPARLDLATFNRNPNQEVLRVTWNNQASNCKPVFKSSDRLLMRPQTNHYRMRDSSIQHVDNGRLFSRENVGMSPRDPAYRPPRR